MSDLNEQIAMRQDFERRCLEHFQAKRAAGVKYPLPPLPMASNTDGSRNPFPIE